MKLVICTIRDLKAAAFQPPFFTRTNETALRWFEHQINDPTTDLGKYPRDYAIYRLGTWDDETAKFELEHVQILVEGFAVKRPATQTDN